MIVIEKLNELEERFEYLEIKLSQPLSPEEIKSVSVEYSELKIIVDNIRNYKKVISEIEDIKFIIDDPEMKVLVAEELNSLTDQLAKIEEDLILALIPKDNLDVKSGILEIRAGTGGDEAALFAADLLRMYQRFSDNMRWSTTVISESFNELGGLKEVVMNITGANVFSYLKYESGVHRVQRVPITESGGRVHTSAATVAVLPEAEEVDIIINPNDLRIDTMRASGSGGQHVNTTDSAVRITHLPSGIVVTSSEKSQHQNRAIGMQVLRSKLLEMERNLKSQERDADRKEKVGSGDRSERIRTYNFPQGRITDHRINLTLHKLEEFLNGDAFEELSQNLRLQDQEIKLANLKQ